MVLENIKSLKILLENLIHPRGSVTKELLNYLRDLTPSDGPVIPLTSSLPLGVTIRLRESSVEVFLPLLVILS